MGSRAKVTVCYGIDFGVCDGDGCFDGDEDGYKAGGTTPGELRYFGSPAGFPVEVVTYGHYDYRRAVLAAAGLTTVGRPWEPVPLADIIPDLTTCDAALKAYCDEHGLTYSQPRWLAVPYYG